MQVRFWNIAAAADGPQTWGCLYALDTRGRIWRLVRNDKSNSTWELIENPEEKDK